MKKTLLILSIMTLFFAGCKKDDMFEKGDMGVVNGHAWVDLGLPSGTKWATCNVGATSPEEYGDYFAWGETATKAEYTYGNCPTYGFTKYQLQSQGYIDSEGNLTSQYDAARANWGGNWRMPTKAEQEELLNNCTCTWTTYNGVKGYKVTGPNDNSVFLPAAGYRDGSSLYRAGYGRYWSSTPDYCNYNYNYNNYYYYAFGMYFFNGNEDVDWDWYCYYRSYGFSVRPVVE